VKDATVQGSEASASIANGIHHLDRSEDVDSIIVGRGGGSDSNPQAFNTERVAETIFTANTPIVTAIGHTDDRLVADRVADMAAITPTAAGEYIVNSREDVFAGEVKPLAQQLDAAYETFQQEHEHEQELAEAVDEATAPEGLPPDYYKAAIAVLLLLAITGL
jgi:exodeoxyribonuclease VII large subunit